MSPVTPNEFKQIIPSPGANFCEKFLNALKLPFLIWKWFKYMCNDDGSFTDTFKADICALNCSGSGAVTSGLAPTTVRASDGTYLDRISVSWDAVTRAEHYDLWRGTTGVRTDATKIGNALTGLAYEDTAITQGTVYYYWVRAYNAASEESWSSVESGHAGTTPPIAPTVDASDGDYTNKIAVTWLAVEGVTAYDLYRSTTNLRSSATRIVEATLARSYDDTSVTPGTTYYYWVRAYSSSIEVWSESDAGYANVIPETIDAITDLQATKGIYSPDTALINLVWTPIAGADAYDIYVSSVNNFAQATLVDGNRAPLDNSRNAFPTWATNQNPFYNNGDELVYQYKVQSMKAFSNYYFWVRAKRTIAPTAQSDLSNSGTGVQGRASGGGGGSNPISDGVVQDGNEFTIPATVAYIWLAFKGSGGNGAGSSLDYGGGGGGGGAIITGSYNVVEGAKIRIRSDPLTLGARATSGQNGVAGPVAYLEYSADGAWDDTVLLATCSSAGGGVFDGAGGGAGGAGASSIVGAITLGNQYDGRNGMPGAGEIGGRSGCRFGDPRLPAAHYNTSSYGSWAGDGPQLGSGSGADSSIAALLRTGGIGGYAFANFVLYAS